MPFFKNPRHKYNIFYFLSSNAVKLIITMHMFTELCFDLIGIIAGKLCLHAVCFFSKKIIYMTDIKTLLSRSWVMICKTQSAISCTEGNLSVEPGHHAINCMEKLIQVALL